MPGRGLAVTSGAALRDKVADLGRWLELDAVIEVSVGRRLWGARRQIDVVLTEPVMRRRLGLECKYQAIRGTAQEKIPAIINDIASWPIDGLVVFEGPGFTDDMKAYMLSTGKAVEFDELETWLRLYFGLDLVG